MRTNIQIYRWLVFISIQFIFADDLSSFYNISATDRSLSYLNVIFGPLTGIGPNASANAFSFIVVKLLPISVAIGFFFGSYVSYMGTLKSAIEGQFLGQRWGGNFLIPIRGFVGFSLLVPDVNGYAYIQKIFITFVLAGIGLANNLWEMIVDNYSKGQGFISQSAALSDSDALIAKQAIKVATLYAYLQNNNSSTGYTVQYTSDTQKNVGLYVIDELGNKNLAMVFFASDQTEAISDEHLNALETLITTAINDPVVTYAGTHNFTLNSNDTNREAWMYSYVQVANYLLMKTNTNQNSSIISKEGGWIQAGSFYWTLAQSGGAGNSDSQYLCGVGNCASNDIYDTGIGSIDNTLNINLIEARLASFGLTLDGIAWKTLTNTNTNSKWYDAQQKLRKINYNQLMLNLNLPENMFTTDPLLIFIQACQTMLYNILVTICLVISTLIVVCFLGVMRYIAPGKGMILMALLFMFSVVVPLVIMMVPPAALGGYYLPLIPFVIFCFGSIAWLLKVIEAIVAAPFVAMIIIQPTDDEFGKAQHAFGMLANIVFRPAMMLIGFAIALKLLAVGYFLFAMVYYTYVNYLINSLDSPALYCFLFMLLSQVVVTLMVILVNRIFSVIYMIPDKVFSWIGIHGSESDVQSAVNEVKKGAQEGISAISKILKTAETSIHGMQKITLLGL